MRTSVKVIPLHGDYTLLALNPRDEWELIGVWFDNEDAELTDTAMREVLEETAACVKGLGLIDARMLEPIPEHKVVLIIYSVELSLGDELMVSDEYRELRWFHMLALSDNLPETYRSAINLAFSRLAN